MFSKESIKRFLKGWHPDGYFQKGTVEFIEQRSNDFLASISMKSASLKDIKQSVKNVVSPVVYREGNKYLRDWQEKEASGSNSWMFEKYNENGVYPWPIKLSLNPNRLEKRVKQRYESETETKMLDQESKMIAAYITFITERVLYEMLSCVDTQREEKKVRKRTIPLELFWECSKHANPTG